MPVLYGKGPSTLVIELPSVVLNYETRLLTIKCISILLTDSSTALTHDLQVNLARETLKGLLAHWLAKRRQRHGSQSSANGDVLSGKDITPRSLARSRIEVDGGAENDSMVYPPFEFSINSPPSIITEGSQGGPWRKKVTDLDGTEDEKDFPWWCLDCVLNNRLPPRENTKYPLDFVVLVSYMCVFH